MHTDDGHGAVHLQPEHQTECEKFEAAKELMDRLKQQLGPMAGTLDLILREIASKFIAKPEERLMAVVHALLTRSGIFFLSSRCDHCLEHPFLKASFLFEHGSIWFLIINMCMQMLQGPCFTELRCSKESCG